MSALRPPELGPIVGHTTPRSCRLWIQSVAPESGPGAPGGEGRSVGIIGVLSKSGRKVDKAYYFRLQREFDRSGAFMLGKDVALGRHALDGVPESQRDEPFTLLPDTEYTVRMATMLLDDPTPDAETLSDSELARRLPPINNIAPLLLDLPADACEATFRTFPEDDAPAASLSFLLGSCRYPGWLWKVKEADRIFGPMVDQLSARATGPRFTLMVGDQIYGDTLTRYVPIGRADTYEEFQERYHTAYRSPNMRRLLRTAPTYMILDDHEIEDNWTQDRIHDEAKHRLFNVAIGAYMSYQWSHGPRSFGRFLYYYFDCAGYPFFVLDTRTQRFKDDIRESLADNHMLGYPMVDPAHRGQLQCLLEWLSAQQRTRGNVPKFIATSSVFAPNAMNERIAERVGHTIEDTLFESNRERRLNSDSWPAYPGTKRQLVEHIHGNGIQNVVFLSGDIHCSNIAALDFDPNPAALRAYDITSSAFYWPFPFADGDPNGYVHESRYPGQTDLFPFTGGEMHYRAWAFTQEDNYCRIQIDRAASRLTVEYFDRNGQAIWVSDTDGALTSENTLPLAPW
ncbi:alkaline phosphatase family protein [bacterium]|nr:alkaline phosphatase family protein [bacterium]